MTVSVYRKCKFCGDLHDVYDWPDNHREWGPDNRSELSAPSVISDNLESVGGLNGVQSQADGRYYTSKAALRADYRARGMVEVGNDPGRAKSHHLAKKPKIAHEDVRPAVERAFSMVELTTPTRLPRKGRKKSKSKAAASG